MSYLKVRDLIKTYERRRILDHVSFDVKRGELIAVLGPNGAGKSTLLKAIAALIMPESGSIEIDGMDRHTRLEEIKRFTSYLGDLPVLDDSYTPRGYLSLVADIYRRNPAEAAKDIDDLLRIFNLTEVDSASIGTLSKGQYKKVALASSLVTHASFFIFDEPFTGGVDPAGAFVLRRILKRMADEERITVLFATQVLSIAKEVAHRYLIVHGGRIVAYDTEAAILKRTESSDLEEAFWKLTTTDAEGLANSYLERLSESNR